MQNKSLLSCVIVAAALFLSADAFGVSATVRSKAELLDAVAKASDGNGLLVQDLDRFGAPVSAEQCVTAVKPTPAQLRDLAFGWKIVGNVKSNAIVVVKDGMTLGVGAGQMNRIGSAKIALEQAEKTLSEEGRDIRSEGLVLASDGFFPFDDCVTLAAEYGVKAIVQPGGSIRDEDSVRKADENGITMLFTGERHFKH